MLTLWFNWILKDQINSYRVDPSAPLPDDETQWNGVMAAEPCPLSADGLAGFTEEMAGVAGKDLWDISQYLNSLDVLSLLKQLNSSSSAS